MSQRIIRIFTVVSFLILVFAFVPPEKSVRVWMIGDSTMAIKQEAKKPETGWGEPFASLLEARGFSVTNLAANGRSTKSFIHEGRWDKVKLDAKPGDYVFIQFGHNDEKIDKPGVGTRIEEYKKNLELFISESRAKGAIPVLLTPIARRKFVRGELIDTHGGYPATMKAVAESAKVLLIDMTTVTSNILADLGEEASKSLFLHVDSGHVNYPNGAKDNTHLNNSGAETIAKAVLKELEKVDSPLVK